MEVSIRTCAACGTVVMGGESNCTGCGQAMPVEAPPPESGPSRMPSKTPEVTCGKCGARVPRSVLRCRDCGAFMRVEIEAAMLAKQMSRGYAGSGRPAGAAAGGLANPASSSFTEVADDADFDLDADLNLLDITMQGMVNQQDRGSKASAGIVEDDFEMGDGSGGEEYVVSGTGNAAPQANKEAPSASEAATESDSPSGVKAESAASTPAEAQSAKGGADMGGTESDVAHSIQTAGDVLLDAAIAEERDAEMRGKGGHRRLRRSAASSLAPDRVLVFCPNGHRIQVHSKHRGRTGRCPNCKALYFVPAADTEQTLGQAGGTVEGTATTDAAAGGATPDTGYTRWITGVYLHRLNPAKLKLKAGSMIGEHEIVDLGGCSEHVLLAVLFAGGGAFRSMQEPKKTAANRQKMLEHLAAKLPVSDIPLPKHYLLTPEALQQLKIVYPAIPGEESLFADVPVFGEGRIAVRVPAADAAGERTYLSFTLSQFRSLSAMLSDSFGLTEFGGGTPIPMTDDFQEATCNYSEAVLRSLPVDKLVYYRADPTFKLVPVGRRCQKCNLVVSEDSRKKEKIGGKSDASVAKAKCPKCKQKFGDITLYGFPQEALPIGAS
jgi:hypothetical protein